MDAPAVESPKSTRDVVDGCITWLVVPLGFKSEVRQDASVKYIHIQNEERQSISLMRGMYIKVSEIARRLGRHPSSIYRELKRNASAHDGNYRFDHAIGKASGRQKRSRRNMRYKQEEFRDVEAKIRQDLSPEQVVGRMRMEGHPVMSHETIYKWIWMDMKRGGTLWEHLRGARKQRRKRYARKDSRGRLAGKKMIESRPAEVETRGRIGDWEIDTVHGKGKPGVVTVVERCSGLVRIGKLKSISMEQTKMRTVSLLSKEKDKVITITADNGSEFHNYKKVEKALETEVYFATPHHAWERGSNENTNGLIRQYLPKGKDLRELTQRECTKIAERLNNRPRKRLQYRTPNEVYYVSDSVALQT